ncbi:hypothetical protein PFISCL1PPCAC_26121, partial [Pristionchus fissidentatus]
RSYHTSSTNSRITAQNMSDEEKQIVNVHFRSAFHNIYTWFEMQNFVDMRFTFNSGCQQQTCQQQKLNWSSQSR